jgi:hypothetical protein
MENTNSNAAAHKKVEFCITVLYFNSLSIKRPEIIWRLLMSNKTFSILSFKLYATFIKLSMPEVQHVM